MLNPKPGLKYSDESIDLLSPDVIVTKNKNGNDVPAGVYFYSIEIGHDFDPIKGTVTILK